MQWMFGAMQIFMAKETIAKMQWMSNGPELRKHLGSSVPKEYGGSGPSLAETGITPRYGGVARATTTASLDSNNTPEPSSAVSELPACIPAPAAAPEKSESTPEATATTTTEAAPEKSEPTPEKSDSASEKPKLETPAAPAPSAAPEAPSPTSAVSPTTVELPAPTGAPQIHASAFTAGGATDSLDPSIPGTATAAEATTKA